MKTTRAKNSNEATEQNAYIQYLDLMNIPFAVVGNENIWSGIIKAMIKNKSTAFRIIYSIENKLKSMGKRKGINDVIVLADSKYYSGLLIEFKYGYNKLSKEQIKWFDRFKNTRYYCVVCYSAKDAIDITRRYLDGENLDG